MTTLTSFGGPLIGMSRASADRWSGIDGKSFIAETARFPSDYEAACDLVDGRGKPPCNIAKLSGLISAAILIAPPVETAFLWTIKQSIFLAQVEAAEPSWSFQSLSEADFEQADFDSTPKTHFTTESCQFVLFDSAVAWAWIGKEFIEWQMASGKYLISYAAYNPDPSTSLTLYKLAKVD